MSREFTDEDIESFGISIYLSIKNEETINCTPISGIYRIDKGDKDLVGRIFDGGPYNKETQEQMRIFDTDNNKERVLNVPWGLHAEVFKFMGDNQLKVSDLKSGKLLIEIHRINNTDWDLKLTDKNYQMVKTPDDNNLRFTIFKEIAARENGITADQISNSLGGKINRNEMEKTLDDLTFLERKIKKVERDGVEYFLRR